MNGLFSPLLRYFRLSLVGPYLTGSVLDYGCGKGALSQYSKMQDYTGVDIDSVVLTKAARKYPQRRFFHLDEFNNKNDRFDTISSLATIGALDDKLAFLTAMKHRLNDGGKIILTTPHPRAHWIHQLGASLGLFGDDLKKTKAQFLSWAQIETLAQQAGLTISLAQPFMLGTNQLFVLVPMESAS